MYNTIKNAILFTSKHIVISNKLFIKKLLVKN